MKLNKKSIAPFLLAMIAISIMASTIFYTMQEFTGKEYGETAASGYVRTFIMMLLLIIGIINRKKLTVLDENWIKIFFVALCLQPIAQFNPALFRINYYFYFFIILLAPSLVRKISSEKSISFIPNYLRIICFYFWFLFRWCSNISLCICMAELF